MIASKFVFTVDITILYILPQILFAFVALSSCAVRAAPGTYDATGVRQHDSDGDRLTVPESIMMASVKHVPEIMNLFQDLVDQRVELGDGATYEFADYASKAFRPLAEMMMKDAIHLQGRSMEPEDQKFLNTVMRIFDKYSVDLFLDLQNGASKADTTTSKTGTVGVPGQANTVQTLITGGQGLTSLAGWGGYVPYTVMPHTMPGSLTKPTYVVSPSLLPLGFQPVNPANMPVLTV